MRIKCPWCGSRDNREFTYYGDATVKRPKEGSALEKFTDYVYMRKNVRGDHLEYWQHTGGCRSWVKVVRNTITHEISESVIANKPTKFEKGALKNAKK